ncbi:hypothetical protein PIB30_062766 [Stylosanthes scabra]|uniref:Uncharacterized protein n=1 Tax=Stylosanthes scabra TaxID=79078 RepID=A0ABU6VL12_9FABA|nr:hypothetical protein [Stylosanthes scabra]
MTPIVVPPLRKWLRCSLAQHDNNVSIDISDAEDDVIVLEKHKSGLSQASQSPGPTTSKGKSIINHPLRTKAKSTGLLASNYSKVTKIDNATSFFVPCRLPSRYLVCRTSKAFRCKFKPCAKMQLKKRQIEAYAYAFCASINHPEFKDSMVWSFNPDGRYSAKSFVDEVTSRKLGLLQEKHIYNKLWDNNIPPRYELLT